MRKMLLAMAAAAALAGCAVYPDGSLAPAPVYVQPAVVAPAPVFVGRPWGGGWGHPGWHRPGWGHPGWHRPGWGHHHGWGRPGWGHPGWRRW